MDLLIEIKIIIASFDQEAWIKLVLYDSAFCEYAYTVRGKQLFIKLFTTMQVVISMPITHTVREWRIFDKLHRNDGPANIDENGNQYWYQNDQVHRDNGPAEVYASGTLIWCQHGQYHRHDGPAMISVNGGYYEWYYNGKRHRIGGPASIHADGCYLWYQHGQLHREDGPAIIWEDGEQRWCLHDCRVNR